MERSLKDVIKEVGKEYDMDDEIIDSIVKKLQKEFYLKLKHMKNLSIETWKSLDLPINLYYVIKELYDSALLQEKQINENTTQPFQERPSLFQPNQMNNQISPKMNLENNKRKEQINIFNKINSNDRTLDLQDNLSLLFSEIDSLDKSRQIFKQIYKIITNIAHNPDEEKYRRFNIQKFLSAFNYKNIVPLFLCIGFKQVDEYMYLLGDGKNMNKAMTDLNSFIKTNHIAESTFDPYKGSISSISGNEEKLKRVQSNEVNFDDLYYKEISRRNKLIDQTKVSRNPKFYKLENNYSINRIINTINSNEESLISNSEDDKLVYKNSMALLKQKQNDRFTLKSRTRFENLMKTPIYVKSDIRLKFPDEHMLQGTFALNEKIENIYSFIREYLNNPQEEFSISTTPPLKRYTNMKGTIQEEKLFPNILMYVNFGEIFGGLNQEKTEEISSNLELTELDEDEAEDINTIGGYTWGNP